MKLTPRTVATKLGRLIPQPIRNFLAPASKSIAAAAAALAVGYIGKLGFDVDVDDVEVVILALLTGGGTYASPANRPRR